MSIVLNGGYNYGGVIETDARTLEEAAEMWYDRYASNGHRKVDGVLWPCFGDMDDSDAAVVDYKTDEYLRRGEIIARFMSD